MLGKRRLTDRIVNAMQLGSDKNIATHIIEIICKQPYTYVRLSCYHRSLMKDYAGDGFSKVSWPDRYDVDEGIRIATKRAARDIATQILFDLQ